MRKSIKFALVAGILSIGVLTTAPAAQAGAVDCYDAGGVWVGIMTDPDGVIKGYHTCILHNQGVFAALWSWFIGSGNY